MIDLIALGQSLQPAANIYTKAMIVLGVEMGKFTN